MKKALLISVALLIATFINADAQSVGINSTGAAPDASAMLDVSSTNKGVLVPRMTQAQRDLIDAPTTGLMIYQSNNSPGFYYYNGTAWTGPLGTGAGTLAGDVTGNAGSNTVATVGGKSATSVAETVDACSTATATNTPSKLVLRDGSGNFAAGTITANLSGNATNVTGTVAIANGGTGQTSAANAVNALVPDQTGNSGKYLTTNGTAVSWGTIASGSLPCSSISSNTTLSTATQFVYATAACTITLPATPATGQIVYVYVENNSATYINPNGHFIRQGATDYNTSLVSEFGNAATYGLILLYNGTYWFPMSWN